VGPAQSTFICFNLVCIVSFKMSVLHFNAHWSNSGVVLILSNNYYNYALKIYKEILLKKRILFCRVVPETCVLQYKKYIILRLLKYNVFNYKKASFWFKTKGFKNKTGFSKFIDELALCSCKQLLKYNYTINCFIYWLLICKLSII